MTQANLLSSKCSGWYLGKVRFLLGGWDGLGLFGCIDSSKVLTLPLAPAKEKRDPSQKIT